ncbi:hypothetical protein MJH12_17055, partial [bacterium]|nr:hypothetical protein [bacterium]
MNVVSQGEATYLTGDTTRDGSNSNGGFLPAASAGLTYVKNGSADKSAFVQGVDYTNAGMNWATYGVAAPAGADTWSDLSFGQKNAVALDLGYTQTFNSNAGELVGRYKDEAKTSVDQIKSKFIANNTGTLDSAHSKWSSRESSVDNDTSGGIWDISYDSSTGERIFEIVLRADDSDKDRDPNWDWQPNSIVEATD